MAYNTRPDLPHFTSGTFFFPYSSPPCFFSSATLTSLLFFPHTRHGPTSALTLAVLSACYVLSMGIRKTCSLASFKSLFKSHSYFTASTPSPAQHSMLVLVQMVPISCRWYDLLIYSAYRLSLLTTMQVPLGQTFILFVYIPRAWTMPGI